MSWTGSVQKKVAVAQESTFLPTPEHPQKAICRQPVQQSRQTPSLSFPDTLLHLYRQLPVPPLQPLVSGTLLCCHELSLEAGTGSLVSNITYCPLPGIPEGSDPQRYLGAQHPPILVVQEATPGEGGRGGGCLSKSRSSFPQNLP